MRLKSISTAGRWLAGLMLFLCWLAGGTAQAQPVMVKVVQTPSGWQLLRGGKPYFIQGAGGNAYFDQLVEAGGNSLRTWSTDELVRLLPEAQKRDLTVTAGLWIGHERHGFSYADPMAVQRQFEKVQADVERFKGSPAILLWAIGNEAEGTGANPLVWKAIERIAGMIKQHDVNHPTMTVLAEITPAKIQALKQYCPSVDILGVNSYRALATLPQRLKDAGWTKPFIVTEFGPPGQWESDRTPWNVAYEWSSGQKADFYLANYQQSINAQRGWCLGSYVFRWGWKQEYTSTWFGMFTAKGERTQMVDAMTFAWRGRLPANRAPVVRGIESTIAGKYVNVGELVPCRVLVSDPDRDPLTVRWEVRWESVDKKYGGDAESVPPVYPNAIGEAKGVDVLLVTPRQEGAFRLFVYVYDGKGNVGTANIPFYVRQ